MKEVQIYSGTGAADAVSVPYQIDDLTNYSVEVEFSGGGGDLAGVLTLEASVTGNNYVTIAGSAQTVVTSTNHVYDVEGAGYKWFQCRWVYTSGTGNILMSALIKQPVTRSSN